MTIERRRLLAAGAALAAGLAQARPDQARADQVSGPVDAAKVPYYPPVVPGMAQPAWTPDEERLHTDWAYLARYKADNETLRAKPQSARRVVFMGDSITQIWIDAHPDFFAQNGFVDRGIGGQVTGQMLVRFRQDVISLKPLAVHINGGTNDIAENAGLYDPVALQNNLMSMAELARVHGIRVILSAITPAGDYRWRPGFLKPAIKIPEMNAWIAAYAKAQGFVYADYTPALSDGHGAMKPGLSSDGVHPTPEGFSLMEPVTLKAVAEALG